MRNYILTIGGFDPSNGAGIGQDVKTLECLGAYALSVMTGLTFQNEREVRSVKWMTNDEILAQADVLLEIYPVGWVKISLVRNLASLNRILDHLTSRIPKVRIVWDPVQASSTGFIFNDQSDLQLLGRVLERLYLALPNRREISQWGEAGDTVNAGLLSRFTNICLKGGHDEKYKGRDILYLKGGEFIVIEPRRISTYEKHGSGCVFASAVTARLASGSGLEEAIRSAKDYVEEFIDGSPSLLGMHSGIKNRSAEIEY